MSVENGPKRQNPDAIPNVVTEIYKRAANASNKVRERVLRAWIPNMLRVDSAAYSAEEYRDRLKGDFETLLKEPGHPEGGGHYEGWTSAEIRELYSVIYGEDLP